VDKPLSEFLLFYGFSIFTMGPSEPKNLPLFFRENFSVLKLKLGNGRMPFKDLVVNYKPMKIVNDDARVVNKLEASLTVDTRVVIYNRHMFIVQAAGFVFITLHFLRNLRNWPYKLEYG
jgi:hypothetical protein